MSETEAFARSAMIPAAEPPVSERGAIKWLRENLFSGPVNIALTLIGLWIVWSILSALIPWLLNSVWNAGSLGECRQIVLDRQGLTLNEAGKTVNAAGDLVESTGGACWAVIRERWNQWLFGFYPRDLYWRPTLALVLMFVALAPVLFQSVPRRLFWFTILFPGLGFWLLWGGTAWVPVGAMLGFVVLGASYRVLQGSLGVPVAAGLGIVTAALWWLYPDKAFIDIMSRAVPVALAPVSSDEFGGFLLALVIGVTAISFSLPLGILLALGRQSDMFIVKTLSVGFIEFIRGVPLITLLFTASLLLQYFLPPGTNFDIILRVIILVTFFAAAYLAEVIRGGLAALPRGQYEAADALGLDYWRAQRLIIMPQALKVSIPGIVSTFIGLFKDTTLVSFVGLLDPLRGVTAAVRADINWKGIYWEPYIFVGAIFFVFCFGMSRYSMYLERKLRTDRQ
ncbi:MAG: amino acid ABC transporter permease [Pseudomonadota bacterium]